MYELREERAQKHEREEEPGIISLVVSLESSSFPAESPSRNVASIPRLSRTVYASVLLILADLERHFAKWIPSGKNFFRINRGVRSRFRLRAAASRSAIVATILIFVSGWIDGNRGNLDG